MRNVRGNCDLRSAAPELISEKIAGKKFFITHGHRYHVKDPALCWDIAFLGCRSPALRRLNTKQGRVSLHLQHAPYSLYSRGSQKKRKFSYITNLFSPHQTKTLHIQRSILKYGFKSIGVLSFQTSPLSAPRQKTSLLSSVSLVPMRQKSLLSTGFTSHLSSK